MDSDEAPRITAWGASASAIAPTIPNPHLTVGTKDFHAARVCVDPLPFRFVSSRKTGSATYASYNNTIVAARPANMETGPHLAPFDSQPCYIAEWRRTG
jgi:hypothetical protein